MHGFSTVDGFVEINECLTEMIKYVANEPSVGLFYIQQHTQNAVPNVINLKNTLGEKSRETALHTEDMEDSISMVTSMKECGLPIVDEMIGDINKSLSIMSTNEPIRGLIHNPSSGSHMGRSTSWGPVTWSRNPFSTQQDGERQGGYISTVFKTAKQKASNFKWSQKESNDPIQVMNQNLPSASSPPTANTGSNIPGMEGDEMPVSSQIAEEKQGEGEDNGGEAVAIGQSSSMQKIFSMAENYEDFKADREARLKDWLEGNSNSSNCKAMSNIEGH